MDVRWVSVALSLVAIGMGARMKVADGSLKNKTVWGTLGAVFILCGVMVLVVLVLGMFGVRFRSPIFFGDEQVQSLSADRGGIRKYTSATPCQLRISESERERIQTFLQEYNSQRLTVKKIEIVVERGRKDNCLYAEDLKRVFEKISWVPPEIVEEIPVVKEVRGKAVWFENSKDDEFARVFWTQILCFLGQDFYHENPDDTSLKEKWIFYIRDSKGGFEPYSPEVICLNRSPSRESLPRNP